LIYNHRIEKPVEFDDHSLNLNFIFQNSIGCRNIVGVLWAFNFFRIFKWLIILNWNADKFLDIFANFCILCLIFWLYHRFQSSTSGCSCVRLENDLDFSSIEEILISECCFLRAHLFLKLYFISNGRWIIFEFNIW
jgi:hypothetical protein